MSLEVINTGTAANSGDGDNLRAAMTKAKNNFAEIYADDFVTSARIADDVALGGNPTTTTQTAGDNSTKIATTAYADTAVANAIDAAPAALDTLNELAASLNDDADFAGTMTTSLAGKLSTAAGSVGTSNLANDAVTHDKLEARYTTKGSITTYTGAVSVDWSTATNFVMGSSLTGAIEFDFTNFKTGQVLTIHNLTGSQTITLDSDAATSETFNKVGGNDYDGASTNVLIVECIDDDATAVFNYSILTYTSDTTP